MVDRTKPIRTIMYKGERIKVTDRDYGLYKMLEAGEITEAQLEEFQASIAADSTYVNTQQQVHIALRAEVKQAAQMVDPDIEASAVPEGDGDLEDWKALPPEVRFQLYASIGAAMLQDLKSVPLEYIDVYTYGVFHDSDAMDTLDEMDEGNEKTAFDGLLSPNMLQNEIMEYQFGIEDQDSWDLDEQGRPFLRDGEVSDEIQMKLARILNEPGIENEPIFDAALMAVVSLGTSTAVSAAGAAAPGLLPGIARMGTQAGVQTYAMGSVVRGVPGGLKVTMAVAGRILGNRGVQIVAGGGSAIGLATGGPGLIARSIQAANPDEEVVDKLIQESQQIVPALNPSHGYDFPYNPDDPLGAADRFAPLRGTTPGPQMGPTVAAGAAGGRPEPQGGPVAAAGGPTVPNTGRGVFNTSGPAPDALSEKAETAREEELATEEYEADPFIGVDRDYRVQPRVGDPWGGGKTGVPMYHQTDVDQILSRMTPGQLDDLQGYLVDARIIDEDARASGRPYYPGVAGYQTVQGLEYVLGLANRSGRHWAAVASEMAVIGRERTAEEEAEKAAAEADAARVTFQPYVPETYVEPDMATLRETARDAIETKLGRKVNSWEMQLLADQMQADHRENFDAREAGARAAYTAEAGAYAGGKLYEPTYVDEGEAVEAVDYEARMAEQFRKMFGKEEERRERTEFVADQSQNLFAGFDNAANLIGR
jgi:hypothetical protein